MKYISIKSFYDIKLKILEDKNNKLLEIIKKQKIIISQISQINTNKSNKYQHIPVNN
tara:strand:+ start:831 stop:1001 length:171 start_codon:yes stop_codon:yes gene_type:complete